MAQYIKIPKDLDDIKEKFVLHLTKRQFICFAIGFAIGLPVFFWTKKYGIEIGIFAMGFAASPAIVCGIYKKNGLTFENYLKAMIKYIKRPKIRKYKSENVYEQIERQIEINKLRKQLYGGVKIETKKGKK